MPEVIRLQLPEPPRAQGWWKHVTGVDRALAHRGAFALEGQFLRSGQHELPVGTVLVRGHRKLGKRQHDRYGAVFVVRRHGLELVRGNGANEEGEYHLSKQIHEVLDLVEEVVPWHSSAREVWVQEELRDVPTEVIEAELRRRRLTCFSTNDLFDELHARGALK